MPYEVLDSPSAGRYEMLPAEQPSQGFLGNAWNSLKNEASTEVGRVGNILAGGVKGATDIGATLLTPIDAAARGLGFQNDYIGRTDRRQGVTDALTGMGADPNSIQYGAGRLGAQVAGTAGIGSLFGQAVRAIAPAASPFANAVATGLETGGFRVPGMTGIPALVTRAATGAANGYATAGLVDPSTANTGAVIGGTLPVATQLAGATGSAIRNAISGGGASPEVRQLAQRAEQLGINVPADRLVDSKPLNAAASSLNYVPFSGRAATEDTMNSQLNRALSRTFGQNDSNVTMALRRAEGDLGSKFDKFLQSNAVSVDPQFMNDLATAGTQANRELSTEGAGVINNQINEILSKGANGQIDGQAAYNIKKTLDRIGNRNSPEAWYALDLKGRLMDALNRSVGPQQAQEFGALRKQYGNMLTLQKLAKNGVDGEVSAARLANLTNINNKDVQELADIAAQFVKPREGMHGAAQRVYGAGGVMGLAGAGFAAGGPLGAAVAPLATVGVGRAGNAMLNSNAARNFVLGSGVPQPLQPMGLLTQGAYRALPLTPGLLGQ